MSDYRPPLTITAEVVRLVEEIGEALGRRSSLANRGQEALRLRRIDQVRTIHGSLAIEGNSLSEEQITAILEGKRVVAPPRDILEAQNAIAAYDRMLKWQPTSGKDLLEAHDVLMKDLVEDSGKYRAGGVGVMSGDEVIHMGPGADRVPTLMKDLLGWLKSTDDHPLIASSVFHYEFEFIHPFSDGNGRMGRLWQSLILAKWNSTFAALPIESLIFRHQADYYRAIQQSSAQANSAPFVEFVLTMISVALAQTPQDAPQASPQVRKLLSLLRSDGELARGEMQQGLALRDRKSFRERYLSPALEQGLIEMTMPDRPQSPLQKYRLTAAGESVAGSES